MPQSIDNSAVIRSAEPEHRDGSTEGGSYISRTATRSSGYSLNADVPVAAIAQKSRPIGIDPYGEISGNPLHERREYTGCVPIIADTLAHAPDGLGRRVIDALQPSAEDRRLCQRRDLTPAGCVRHRRFRNKRTKTFLFREDKV